MNLNDYKIVSCPAGWYLNDPDGHTLGWVSQNVGRLLLRLQNAAKEFPELANLAARVDSLEGRMALTLLANRHELDSRATHARITRCFDKIEELSKEKKNEEDLSPHCNRCGADIADWDAVRATRPSPRCRGL